MFFAFSIPDGTPARAQPHFYSESALLKADALEQVIKWFEAGVAQEIALIRHFDQGALPPQKAAADAAR